jgi:hypothetical protein
MTKQATPADVSPVLPLAGDEELLKSSGSDVRVYANKIAPSLLLGGMVAVGLSTLALASSGKALSPDAWARPGRPPLSDCAAARLVVHYPETIPQNARANHYRPSNAELKGFYTAHTAGGRPIVKIVPQYRKVTGRPCMRTPSTWDLITWAARKWGIPTTVLHAQTWFESMDKQSRRWDTGFVSKKEYFATPAFLRIRPYEVYETVGIAQIRWRAFDQLSPGADPLRWKSTAWALDFLGATIRYYYDGQCAYCGAGYTKGQAWRSIAAWNSPIPWLNNKKATWYTRGVQSAYRGQDWTQGGRALRQ